MPRMDNNNVVLTHNGIVLVVKKNEVGKVAGTLDRIGKCTQEGMSAQRDKHCRASLICES